jgi:uncharacterized protein YndB with AHSA1/START domain
MAKAEEKITIAAPPERIFALLAQPQRAPEWVPHVEQVEQTSEVASGPGLEVQFTARTGDHDTSGTGKLLEWDPPWRLVLQTAADNGISGIAIFQLAPTDKGTQLTTSVEYEIAGKGVAGLAGGLLGGVVARRQLRKALEFLKSQVEAESQQESAS